MLETLPFKIKTHPADIHLDTLRTNIYHPIIPLFFRSFHSLSLIIVLVEKFTDKKIRNSMASLTMAFGAAAAGGRVFAATAAKGAGGSKEEKGLLDWILGGLQKEDQLLETDPILKKVEEKNGGGGRKNSVAVPPKKKGGFGGLFAKS